MQGCRGCVHSGEPAGHTRTTGVHAHLSMPAIGTGTAWLYRCKSGKPMCGLFRQFVHWPVDDNVAAIPMALKTVARRQTTVSTVAV